MKFIESLLRPHLRKLVPYSSARDEHQGAANVYLDANENPFGTVGGGAWNRYPDPYQTKLKEAISGIKEIDAANIFLGNGSDEPIDLLIRAFCEPGQDKLLCFPPTYGMYRVSADIHDVEIIEVLLTDEFQLDLPHALDASKQAKITWICSPNNPTANSIRHEQIMELVKATTGLVVVDEAYIDFAEQSSLIREIKHHENLVVLQTFSKAWGMASFRLGMAFANIDLVQVLNKIKPPYNISGLVQHEAYKSLMHEEQKNDWVEEVKSQRKWLLSQLEQLTLVKKIFPSDANFLLARFDEPTHVYQYLSGLGIVVRDRSKQPRCEGCLRITIGTPTENKILIQALKDLS
ncbi:MAG: histidinol-phosphate transaminase [Cyclobacteriaceae bacterium]